MARADDGTGGSHKNMVFGVLFGIGLVVALLPPIYIWAGEQHSNLLGLPLSVLYMFGVSGYVTAVCAALYVVELARGELD
ncbi:hypothetical protein K8Z49_16055 [Actinomadura madurae]|uniref:Solute:sodium symporter small subunit n=1 Tax=Actinomadura madurae TaxID=1993 RepID=A0A1I5KQH8_9ACTN|nr:hypothetical protein [Actinomadura madurae]SFO87142.1 hypothetical protein SAMN04489713_11097 [Actinomadura madurae]SPT49901.1 Uncharacterised protein [Actinomadura madurae]